MNITTRFAIWFLLSLVLVANTFANKADEDLKEIGIRRGIIAVLDLPGGDAKYVVELATASELLVYFQSADADQINVVREAAESAGLLGRRIFVDSGALDSIHLADNLADGILVAPTAEPPDESPRAAREDRDHSAPARKTQEDRSGFGENCVRHPGVLREYRYP